MDRISTSPRGLAARSVVAVAVFAAAIVPGWTLGDLVERWTGNGLLDWLLTCCCAALAMLVLAPHASYRRRDAWLALVPLFGWYLCALMAWRVALLPYRDWEPRADELSRARWLTGDLIGYWRADSPVRARRRTPATSGVAARR
ncbi:hypothetical protein [Mangrovihabitans endophyticus]|uniref:Uncharacterized protein n=1 Tax=Mangrovihabitans endophyticus TaxID=1751298 RepID=A0A8J3C5Q4_9ACTN|nr:hypothetical protein [Mangrovihabitans endophyticus]GGL10969.1 hypothetical protein GCM10012284_52110 [Mangrovihabitans endophyticus]